MHLAFLFQYFSSISLGKGKVRLGLNHPRPHFLLPSTHDKYSSSGRLYTLAQAFPQVLFTILLALRVVGPES